MKVLLGRYQKESDPKGWERKIKVKIDKYDIWDTDITLAYIIHPILVKLKKAQTGYPSEFAEELGGGGWLGWEAILNKMIWSFAAVIEGDKGTDYINNSFNESEYEVYNRSLQEGLDLFGKYYRNLWT